MSKPFIFRSGSVAAQSFTATLGEIAVPPTPKKRSAHEAALLRQKAIDDAKAEGFALGHDEGFEVGQKMGYQAGFDQAYAEASTQQAEKLRAFGVELQKVHDDLEATIAEWFANAEIEVEAIALEVAKTLIGAQLHLDRSFVIETTKEALQQISEANKARIRVNPFDSVILSNAREELLAATASLRGIEIVGDASIDGGCIVETERGVVDATVETRLRILEGGLEDVA
ncbi:MAG TPA: FliH/SctL family protein [Fimbriimonadaceae bacterium]|nr:FliH/SctL family protein [Fimbriimonadaceae bacterium]